VLLLGGASSRFGSPKALARFSGETLADRGWRALAWCGERIAVGKGSDELLFSFPVLDDGVSERAPIFGVVAGLRAARHEVCVVLPVDCPLVTVDALRALSTAVAVPQSGPLPGGYSKAMLPELERRIAQRELSLRGVNDRVLQLDPRLLVNVNRPEDLAALT
jgi:molybdopterin-guanine dinucleotide biosynthesis protein A